MDQKVCYSCKTSKDLTEFFKDKSKQFGVGGECKPCNLIRQRKWRSENIQKTKEDSRRWHLKRKYALTPEDYAALRIKQGDMCALCGQVSSRLVVDHCHKNGNVRHLLCHGCNIFLGHASDDPILLYRAIEYLESSEEVT